MNKRIGIETAHSTQRKSFRRRPSQPSTWLILSKQNSTHKNKIQIHKQTTPKYSKTKLSWFSRLLQHSARKWDAFILQCSGAHTGCE